MFEEGLSRGQLGAHRPIALVQAVEDGVYQVGEEDQGRQYGGQVLFAMAIIVFEVVALGLEGIVVFVLDFPAAAAGSDQRDHILGGDRV